MDTKTPLADELAFLRETFKACVIAYRQNVGTEDQVAQAVATQNLGDALKLTKSIADTVKVEQELMMKLGMMYPEAEVISMIQGQLEEVLKALKSEGLDDAQLSKLTEKITSIYERGPDDQ